MRRSDGSAAGWYRKAARRGVAQAQFSLAYFFEQGRGVKRSDAAAAMWYTWYTCIHHRGCATCHDMETR